MNRSEKEPIEVDEKAKDGSAPFDEKGATDRQHGGLTPIRSRGAWLIGAFLFIGAVLLVLWVSARRVKSEAEEKEPVVVSVRVAKAERGPISADVSAIGTIVPKEVATISPKISGQIKSMSLLRNKAVKAGDVIATLESRDLQAQRSEAAAALGEAEANARLVSGSTIPETAAQDQKALRDARAKRQPTRGRRLNAVARFMIGGGISKKELEASQLALTMAESDLSVAETAARLHETTANPNNRTMAASKVKQAQDRLAALDAQLSYATIALHSPASLLSSSVRGRVRRCRRKADDHCRCQRSNRQGAICRQCRGPAQTWRSGEDTASGPAR
jgi:multidrug efflux pump subunit AcrA (membrane-fusion protein)